MTISRKFFSANVTLPANTATSLLQLMISSALHWTFEDTTLTAPSLDSILGDSVLLTPDEVTYLGSDSNVRATTGVGTYKGATLPADETTSLQDFAKYGLIDPNQIYLFNASGTTIDVVFSGR